MKVRDLIRALEHQDPDLDVIHLDGSNWETITSLSEVVETYTCWRESGDIVTREAVELL